MVHNPLSKYLDDLDDGGVDYDFSVHENAVAEESEVPVGMTDMIPTAAVNVTQNHLDREITRGYNVYKHVVHLIK